MFDMCPVPKNHSTMRRSESTITVDNRNIHSDEEQQRLRAQHNGEMIRFYDILVEIIIAGQCVRICYEYLTSFECKLNTQRSHPGGSTNSDHHVSYDFFLTMFSTILAK